MNYKAIITDLDGTAVDSPRLKVVSERLRAATAALEAKGIQVCAATGRAETYAMPVIESMGLKGPAIISDGTQIIDSVSRRELWRCGMSAEQIRAVVECLQGKVYRVLWNDYSEDEYRSGGWSLADFTDYDSIYFFKLCYLLPDEAAEIAERMNSIEGIAATVIIAQREGARDIHITNAAATKEYAIHELERMISVPREAMIGIGDGHNDLHLFNAVGYRVAMGNAVPELKAAADEVIGRINEDGLAIYFEQLAKETNL